MARKPAHPARKRPARKPAPSLILASSSPRRREFFRRLGLPFRVVEPRVHELPHKGELPAAFARRAAEEKAEWVCASLARAAQPSVIVAADTIVVLHNRILQKPADEDDARQMLRMLSGKWHDVISGVCVIMAGRGRVLRKKSLIVQTRVAFKKLTDEEIEFYVASGEPMDKAGAYAVQGLGGFMVRELSGSYTNVVGLPVAEVLDVLERDFSYPLFAAPAPAEPEVPGVQMDWFAKL